MLIYTFLVTCHNWSITKRYYEISHVLLLHNNQISASKYALILMMCIHFKSKKTDFNIAARAWHT